LYTDAEDQDLDAKTLVPAILSAETNRNHDRTILMGDFNMAPFESSLVRADVLHATMSRHIASRGVRTVQGQQFKFLYNPMWGLLGDNIEGRPPGTYFYPSGVLSRFWNMFDQILLRPALLPYYHKESVRIITTIDDVSLLKKEKIDASISDHLPILLDLSTDGVQNE
jgi:hypothetical protein